MERKRRLPAVERYIKDLGGEDFRVRINGVVVEINRDMYTAMIDDGTGRVVVQFIDPEVFGRLKEGRHVRIIGKVLSGEETLIDGEVVQDLSKLDIGLYNRARYVMEKLR
ncbi:MAG: replication protein RepA [Methanobacteriota archaeon]|nr:MAG: replication protein RepA [Euryarchaeota archaeon]